jgi:hypothetical protein
MASDRFARRHRHCRQSEAESAAARALDLSNLQQEVTKTLLRQTGTPAPEALQGQSHGAPIRSKAPGKLQRGVRRA